MANIFNVARYVLNRKGRMSTWKLQKLCYYSQAWSLAWTEHPLFEEDFEAWTNGPVSPQLFKQHKGKFIVSEDDIPENLEDAVSLTDDETDTINRVLDSYGDMEPYELREQSHSEPPWKEARDGISDDGWCDNTITKESMGAYYGSL